MKKEEEGIRIIKKPLKTGAICGVLTLIASFIFALSSFVVRGTSTSSSIFVTFLLVIINVATIFFLYGFFILGKKNGDSLLKITSALLIFGIILGYIVSFMVLSPLLTQTVEITTAKATSLGFNLNTITSEQYVQLSQALAQDQEFLKVFRSLAGLILLCGAIFAVLMMFFGIGIVKLKEKIRFSKSAGVLEVIGVVLIILGAVLLPAKVAYALIFFGLIGSVAAFVLQIIILFDEAKKVKEE